MERSEESDDRSPLLRDPGCSKSYGSADQSSDASQSSDDGAQDAANEASVDLSTDRSTDGPCTPTANAAPSRDSYHQMLLGLNIAAILLGIAISAVLFLELKFAFGQCIIGMELYQGGLLTRGVKRFWCRCPLYTIMLTTTIPWVAIMINWVSDLFTKKCAFGKWLKWQAILTCSGAAAALGATITSAWGFGQWCRRVVKSLDDEDMYTTAVAASTRRECYNAAMAFDSAFPNEFVKLKTTFWYTLSIMILQLALLACWAASCYYSVRMWKRLPKDNFFAQMLLPPDINPRGRLTRRVNAEQPDHSIAAVADQTTAANVNVSDENHLHAA